MKPKRREIVKYRKSKGLASLRTSKNQKGSNSMSKSLKLGGLANLRKSTKGSELTKESPSMHSKNSKMNNFRKQKEKDRQIRNLLSCQSEEESLAISQELKKKNAILRSEIMERQKKISTKRQEGVRSVSMIVGDDQKNMRKKMTSNANKKMEKMKNRGRRVAKKKGMHLNGKHFKTQEMGSNKLPKKSYTSNKSKLGNIKKKTRILRTMPVSKKKSQSRGTKRLSNKGYTKQSNVSQKSRNSNARKVKENSKRSINNIYKRSHSSQQNKQDEGTIYNHDNIKNKYFTEQKMENKINDNAQRRTKGFTHKNEEFENIYKLQKGVMKGRISNLLDNQTPNHMLQNKDYLGKLPKSAINQTRKKSKGSSKSLGNRNDLMFRIHDTEHKKHKRNFSRSGKGIRYLKINKSN